MALAALSVTSESVERVLMLPMRCESRASCVSQGDPSLACPGAIDQLGISED